MRTKTTMTEPTTDDWEMIFGPMQKRMDIKAKVNDYIAKMIHLHLEMGIPIPEELQTNRQSRWHLPECISSPPGGR